MSLRLRLLLALVGLVAVGLLVADGATYLSLHSFLLNRVDQQLVSAEFPVLHALEDSAGNGFPGVPSVPEGESANLPPGTYGCVLTGGGQIVAQYTFSYGGRSYATPSLPAGFPQSVARHGGQQTITVNAAGSSLQFRVIGHSLTSAATGTTYTLVAAIPLTEEAQTQQHLVLIEASVTLAVLVGLGLLAWWIVRRELRPLDDMAATAGAIAAGDLTRRVDRADDRTEVGRLGTALNAMLTQIEEAFTRQHNSENALRRFLAQASHELRTPLASVRGYAELFRRGARERPEDLDLAMRRIEQEAARMGVLVEDLLLLARLDEGRVLDRRPVDLTQLAADAAADARIVAPGRDLSVEQTGPVTVAGDESRLRQVLGNLVTNALRHGGPDARVRLRTSVAGDQGVLEVSDDGFGMRPEVAARAFEPFYRPEESRARGEGTAGLGLSIVAAIAEAHGGHVELETAPGLGATFRVLLPLGAAAEGSAATSALAWTPHDAGPDTPGEPATDADGGDRAPAGEPID